MKTIIVFAIGFFCGVAYMGCKDCGKIHVIGSPTGDLPTPLPKGK